MEGPDSQVMNPASVAATIARPMIGVRKSSPKCASTVWNACMTPAVRLMSAEGTTQLMASGGRIKMTRTRPTATNIAFGNCFGGSSSSLTCTAFISMPE